MTVEGNPSRQTAGSHGAAVAGSGAGIGQGVAADGVDDAGPAFPCPAGVPACDSARSITSAAPGTSIVGLVQPPGGSHDPIAQLGQEGDRHCPSPPLAPSPECHPSPGDAVLLQRHHAEAWRCTLRCRWPWRPGLEGSGQGDQPVAPDPYPLCQPATVESPTPHPLSTTLSPGCQSGCWLSSTVPGKSMPGIREAALPRGRRR